MIARLSAGFGRLLDGSAAIAALLLLGMVMVICADVLLRNLLVSGLRGADELSEYALFLVTMLTAPWLLRKGQHVRVDILLTLMPPAVARAMETLVDLAGLAICLAVIRYGLAVTLESARMGSFTIKSLVFPEWWMLAPLPVCFLLLGVEFLFRLHRLWSGEAAVRDEARSVG